MDTRQHIVVVEDEAAQRQILLDYLSKQGYRVTGFDSGAGLRRLIERELPALVLLDVGLPGEDGFAIARWLRERSGKVCIIMVTAAGDTVDRVVGLETGADDYIVKPFSVPELLARVRALAAAQPALQRVLHQVQVQVGQRTGASRRAPRRCRPRRTRAAGRSPRTPRPGTRGARWSRSVWRRWPATPPRPRRAARRRAGWPPRAWSRPG